jgi:quinohemoprotein ethanol dehydrogenase
MPIKNEVDLVSQCLSPRHRGLARTAARLAAMLVLPAVLAACQSNHDGLGPNRTIAALDDARLRNADDEPNNWMSTGRTYNEQHFSPLNAINTENVGRLGLAWSFDLDTAHRGQESTPLVVDGVMYVTAAWSKVYALNAKTGALLWKYDPQVPGKMAVNACCDVVNRGAAAWHGKIYSGTLDGRLLAIDAATGKLVWQVMTVPENQRYSISGAPRIVKGMVIIGNAGAESGIRGYISAFDAETGKLVWRFYTVPGDPTLPFENHAMQVAAKTWAGDWWKLGGGGPVWDSIVYDPQLDLIYFGTGNGTPWTHAGIGGDSLYLTSVVAVKASSGEYVWHYQETPHDEWDFDSCAPLVLADLDLDGQKRHVILHAPKNGFFYVLDAATGAVLKADPFTTTNWAKSIDKTTGRPVIEKDALYSESGKPFVSFPGPGGGHSWQPMSFSPLTKLVYFPVTDTSFPFIAENNAQHHTLAWNIGLDLNAGSLPQDPKIKQAVIDALRGHLVAWDPVENKERWRVELNHPTNGAVVSTAGNLVFEGTSMGEFVAYQADSGKRLWAAQTQTGVVAAPISYAVDNEQYVAVEVGFGGAFGLSAGELALKSHSNSNVPRILVYKLGGTAVLPSAVITATPALDPPPNTADAATVAKGKKLYHTFCGTCHGDAATGSGVIPDLRYTSVIKDKAAMDTIVRQGALQANGMVAFKDEISPDDLEAIRAYLIFRANESAHEMKTSSR